MLEESNTKIISHIYMIEPEFNYQADLELIGRSPRMDSWIWPCLPYEVKLCSDTWPLTLPWSDLRNGRIWDILNRIGCSNFVTLDTGHSAIMVIKDQPQAQDIELQKDVYEAAGRGNLTWLKDFLDH